ncbi:MAG: hypothetical protein RL117_1707 [Verrucomicrobiota bacterium]
MCGIEHAGMDMIDGPVASFRNVRERVAFHQVGSADHAEQGGSRSEVNYARKRCEVGLAERIGGADESDGFRPRERRGQLDASEFVHGFEVSSGNGDHGMLAS